MYSLITTGSPLSLERNHDWESWRILAKSSLSVPNQTNARRTQQPCSRWWVWWPSPAVDCKPLHPLAPPPRISIIRYIHKNSSARAGPDLTSGSIDYCRPSSLQPSRRPFQFSLPVPARFLYLNDFLSSSGKFSISSYISALCHT